MQVLILLTGKVYVPNELPADRQLPGKDLLGQTHVFDRLEFVNNLQTIAALQHALGSNSHIEIRHIVQRQNIWLLKKQSNALQHFVQQQNIDIVHQFWGGPAAWMMSKATGKTPYVLSLLGSDLMGAYNTAGKSSWKGWLLQWTSRLAAIRANAVVLMSAKMKSRLSPALYNKTHIIPEGIDANVFAPMPMQDAKSQLGWDEAKQYILFFDNGNRVKNAPFAAQVVHEVQQQFPSVEMLRVQQVPHQQLRLYYNAAHALLLPSLHEGSNNSLKEALACNCPVVASAVGDAEERLAGVTHSVAIKGFDVKDFVAAIAAILQADERSNGRQCIEPVTHAFIGHQLNNLYAQLTQQRTVS